MSIDLRKFQGTVEPTNFEVNSSFEVTDIDKAISFVQLVSAIRPKNFAFQPGQVVDPDAAFFARNCHQDVLSFEDFHLLETTPRDELVHFTLSGAVQQH